MMWPKIPFIFISLAVILFIPFSQDIKKIIPTSFIQPTKSVLHEVSQTSFSFDTSEILQESPNLLISPNSFWWLNSGGIFYVENGIGKTIQGKLPEGSLWQKIYKQTNPKDTNEGFQPQNIFRLVTKGTWKNVQQQINFKVNAYNPSSSENFNQSNGVLFFNRYRNGDTLYYAGIRVDGLAVIKKKLNGSYYTIASKKILDGSYDSSSHSNLIPSGTWIGLRSQIRTNGDNTVHISVYIDKDNSGNWQLAAEGVDDGTKFGGPAILDEGHAGIRTDFMDVEFDNYHVSSL